MVIRKKISNKEINRRIKELSYDAESLRELKKDIDRVIEDSAELERCYHTDPHMWFCIITT